MSRHRGAAHVWGTVAVWLCTLAVILTGVVLVLAVVGRADAAQPRTEYMPCSVGPDPVNCVWDGRHNGTDTLNYFVGEGEKAWPVPHHVAHYLVHSTSEHGVYRACEFEDENDCVWDARHQGNGMGRSFYMGHGHVWYLPHHVAHYLLAR